MSIRLANEVREVSVPPYCSACGKQETDRRFVDFDAACDRGYGGEGAVPVALDDLVLCEDCISRGGVVLGMLTVQEADVLRAEYDAMERERAHALREQEKAERYAGTLEDAFEKRPEPISVDHRKKPRNR